MTTIENHRIPDDVARRKHIDDLCNAFEEGWKNGDRPTIASVLSDADENAKAELFTELLPIELHHRSKGNERPSPQEYLEAWPAYESRVRDGFAGFWRVATTELGHFHLIERIATGGFGTVFKAFDSKLSRIVAVKVPSTRPRDSEERERFIREARAPAGLRHPHIVSIHQANEDGELCYIVSDYIDGETLTAHVKRSRPSYRAAAELISKLAEAIHYAHTMGIIHRDMKPDNVLLDARGEPHITDFGLARRIADASLTRRGGLVGTPAYMSPEQADGRGHEASPQSDQWSLGVMLFELLTGERPFSGDDAYVALMQVIRKDPRPLRKCNRSVPKDLETICSKCLEKNPDDRYESCLHLATDLRHWLAGKPIIARRASPWTQATRWCQRNSRLATTAAVAATVTVIAAVLCWQLIRAWDDFARAEYVNNVTRARAAIDRNATASALDFLDEAAHSASDESRGWEWTHAWNLCHQEIRTMHGHSGTVYAVAIHPNGDRIASAGDSGIIRIWSTADGSQLASLETGSARIRSLEYDQGGELLAAAEDTNSILILDAKTLKRRFSLRSNCGIWGLAFHPSGDLLGGAGDDGKAKLWRLEDNSEPISLGAAGPPLKSIRFSPDGELLAGGGFDRKVRIWHLRDKTLLYGLPHESPVASLAFGPDGATIGVGTQDSTVVVWDYVRRSRILTLTGHTGPVRHVEFRPDGQELLSVGHDECIRTWSVSGGRPLRTLCGHTDSVCSARYSAEGFYIASGGFDGTVRLWDAESGHESRTLEGHLKSVECVAFFPDGQRLLSGALDKDLRIWEIASGFCVGRIRTATAGIWRVAISPDGKLIASAGEGALEIFDSDTQRRVANLVGHDAGVSHAEFSPDGHQLVSASADGSAILWDVSSWKTKHRFNDHGGLVFTATFSPDGTHVATSCEDGLIRIWDTRTGKLIKMLEGHKGAIDGIDFSPSGDTLASVGMDKVVALWDLRNGHRIWETRGHSERICDVKFSPKADRLITASDDGSIRMWDVEEGRELSVLDEHLGPVRRLAFSSDGMIIASASYDRTIRLWDGRAPTPRAIVDREAGAIVRFLAYLPLAADDVLNELKDWPDITAPVRKRSTQLSRYIADVHDPGQFAAASWKIVSRPHRTAKQYEFALCQARHACAAAPQDTNHRLTLAAALFRNGAFSEAETTVVDASPRSPRKLAIQAMLSHRLGDFESARHKLDKLRTVMTSDDASNTVDNQRLLFEAESLIDGIRRRGPTRPLPKPFSDAELLVLDDSGRARAEGQIAHAEDRQMYSFVADGSGEIAIRIRPHGELVPFVKLFDAQLDSNEDDLPDGVDTGGFSNTTGVAQIHRYPVRPGDELYVEVRPDKAHRDSSGSFEIVIEPLASRR